MSCYPLKLNPNEYNYENSPKKYFLINFLFQFNNKSRFLQHQKYFMNIQDISYFAKNK